MLTFKRLIAIAALALAAGCSGTDKDGNELPINILICEIEGHRYIKYSPGYGACIIHAESCPCKTAKPAPSVSRAEGVEGRLNASEDAE